MHDRVQRTSMLRPRKTARGLAALAVAYAITLAPRGLLAEETKLAQAGHEDHQHTPSSPRAAATAKKQKTPAKKQKKTPKGKGHPASHKHSGPGPRLRAPKPAAAHQHDAEPGIAHEHGGMAMKALLGPYSMTREGSGTSWLPDTTPHEGIHGTIGDWMVMWHALINGVYDRQGGPRGREKDRKSVV